MIKKLKTFFFIFISFVIIDFIFSLFFFNRIFLNLEKIYSSDLENRIFNKDYKYTFKPNAEFESRYNDFLYTIKTNNYGFRDKSSSDVILNKDTILFLGDSFLEGVGLDYDDTLISNLERLNFNHHINLNAGVSSYSPYIYKKKIISFLKNNIDVKPKKIIILFDKSDPMDDQQYLSKPIFFQEKVKNLKYEKGLSEKFISIAFLKIFGSFLDEKRRDLKYRYIISKKYKTNFFKLKQQQVIAFKSIGTARSGSSYYTDNTKWENKTKKFIIFSFEHLKEIEIFLSKRNIELDIFLFPWPFELVDNTAKTNYLSFFNKVNKEYNLKIHNCYDYFLKENILDQLELIGDSFLYGDYHYNGNGNKILANCIKDKLAYIE